MKNDEEVERYMVHHVAHLLVNHVAPHTWIFNKHHGWLDAGLAHWFEQKFTGLCTNLCYEELYVSPDSGYKGGKWKEAVRRLVDAGKPTRFVEFYKLNTDQLSLQAHAMSFAYVDFLITVYGGAKMRDLLRAAKNKTETRQSLRTIYGHTPLSIEKSFKAWVKKTYPLREQTRRNRE